MLEGTSREVTVVACVCVIVVCLFPLLVVIPVVVGCPGGVFVVRILEEAIVVTCFGDNETCVFILSVVAILDVGSLGRVFAVASEEATDVACRSVPEVGVLPLSVIPLVVMPVMVVASAVRAFVAEVSKEATPVDCG